ncbi:hypothetical protein [Vibrio vulnificus]|uniref:hypothetical protein n=1 Tax=Vibrio vulnificus TaxID=672 RepID=UPI001A289187|nr:hypothetical protein [Vibrio vulnificus]EHD1698885.1 hypothetical protein [Vibrio vulnificus]MCA3966856.1 hypothetical protein [Vibrio vulnificus]HAS6111684.1 hypothetical protein [Vibrio vulnificus]
MSTIPFDESGLFIASSLISLDDFLKTELANGKHIYCCFLANQLTYIHYKEFNKRHVASVSFQNGYTLYPPFQQP